MVDRDRKKYLNNYYLYLIYIKKNSNFSPSKSFNINYDMSGSKQFIFVRIQK